MISQNRGRGGNNRAGCQILANGASRLTIRATKHSRLTNPESREYPIGWHSAKPPRLPYRRLQKSQKLGPASTPQVFIQKHKLEHYLYNGRSNSLSTYDKNDPLDKADPLVLVLSRTKRFKIMSLESFFEV
jgi:hypothetical protein